MLKCCCLLYCPLSGHLLYFIFCENYFFWPFPIVFPLLLNALVPLLSQLALKEQFTLYKKPFFSFLSSLLAFSDQFIPTSYYNFRSFLLSLGLFNCHSDSLLFRIVLMNWFQLSKGEKMIKLSPYASLQYIVLISVLFPVSTKSLMDCH